MSFRRLVVVPVLSLILAALASACASAGSAGHLHHAGDAPAAVPVSDVGFVVAAPDRGFLGDEEVRDAFDAFASGRRARLLFVTDARTAPELDAAVAALAADGARRVVVLPFFLTDAELGFRTLSSLVAQGAWKLPVSLGQRFGRSYLAVEMLADRFRHLPDPAGRRVVVLGYGARDAAARQAMSAELQAMADAAAEGFGFEAVRTVVWQDASAGGNDHRDADAEIALVDAATGGKQLAFVPFQLGPKLDSMMSFSAGVALHARGLATIVDADITPDPLVTEWLVRESNRALPLTPDALGVVFLAHGADHHWNEGMRLAAAQLSKHYKVEFAFCMADQPLVERAVKKLEARGARAIVVVRVFGLESSFKGDVLRMLGLDVEGGARPKAAAVAAPADPHAGHGGHAMGGHAGHAMGGMDMGGAGPAPRIRSTARFVTVGGLEDSPLFADALLDRALTLAQDPARETVILVAHGSGDDATNQHWKLLLESITGRMRAGQGAHFRAIRFGTWREDWPDKRAPEIAAIRGMVEEATRDGGRAIVIPARTSAQGFEVEFLDGLTFTLGQGFAPHPLFEQWLDEQVKAGVAQLEGGPAAVPVPAAAPAPSEHEQHEHHH